MSKTKEISTKKKEILNHIQDLKINFNALSLINKTLVEEKKQGVGVSFDEKDVKEKRDDILSIIRKEEESVGEVAASTPRMYRDYPVYSDNIGPHDIRYILLKQVEHESTGMLRISGEEGHGEVRFLKGSIVYIMYKDIVGERGFFELLKTTQGKTDFYNRDSIGNTRNIDQETSELINKTLQKRANRK